MTPQVIEVGQTPSILALARTPALIGQIREYLGQYQFAECESVEEAQTAFAESSPGIVIFETGVWRRSEFSRLIALLARSRDCTVFVFWRQGSIALAELVEVACAAKNVHPIHENYSQTPLADACVERSRSRGILERVRSKLADRGQAENFSSLLIAALSLTPEPSSVGQFAAAVGMGKTKLGVRCRRAGLPSPVNLLGWARALHVVDRLAAKRGQDPDGLGAAEKTGKNCCEYVRSHTGKGPHSWLACGGFDALLTKFVLALNRPDARVVIPVDPRTRRRNAR
jgi:hypothetical protein